MPGQDSFVLPADRLSDNVCFVLSVFKLNCVMLDDYSELYFVGKLFVVYVTQYLINLIQNILTTCYYNQHKTHYRDLEK